MLTLDLHEIIDRLEHFGYQIEPAEYSAIIFLKEKVINEVKNICNIDLDEGELYEKTSENLKYKVIDKICAEFLLTKLNSGTLTIDDIDMSKIGLKSVTEGDTSVTYATDGGQSREQILNSYLTQLSTLDKEELYKYRKMEW